MGIEPTFPAWKAGVLPIYDTRVLIYFLSRVERKTGFEPATSTLARWRSTIEPLSHTLTSKKMVQMKGVEPPRQGR